MKQTLLKFAARCDKAGRKVNQDNFWICPDVTSYAATGTMDTITGEMETHLSEKGALLVVADGMGGMSAGEVASQIAIDSIKSSFKDLGSVSLSQADSIKEFVKQAIVHADKEIKAHASTHPETSGMGSTIVLVWILRDRVYVGWCGDSRAYCFNAHNTLVRLSHDHSYVQELVDKGTISEEDAFYHPNSNIITRSLGDSGENANPEVKEYPLHAGDTFLLCSDGLCGLLRDSEIEAVLRQNSSSVRESLYALWGEGDSVGWTDNATIEIAQVTDGIAPTSNAVGYDVPSPKEKFSKPSPSTKRRNCLLAVVLVAIGVFLGLFIGKVHVGPPHLSGSDSLHQSIDTSAAERAETTVPDAVKPEDAPISDDAGKKADKGGADKNKEGSRAGDEKAKVNGGLTQIVENPETSGEQAKEEKRATEEIREKIEEIRNRAGNKDSTQEGKELIQEIKGIMQGSKDSNQGTNDSIQEIDGSTPEPGDSLLGAGDKETGEGAGVQLSGGEGE